MARDSVNRDLRFDITQLSKEQRLEIWSSVGGQDEDYVELLHDILYDLFKESENDNDNNFCCKDLNSDDNHFVNFVGTSEIEVFDGENEAVDDDDDDDPEYKLFLSHVKGNGKSFSFERKDEDGICITIEYHKEEPVDGRHHLKKNRINKNRNKDNVEEEDVCWISDYPQTNYFKEKLMALLRKPFDEQEYNTLWNEVTQKRYKLRHKELEHGGEKSVRTQIKTKSYLQKHKTFRRAIKAVRGDKFKKLNILRGFAFWLQHLPCQRSFKPWEDAAYLEVMPGTH